MSKESASDWAEWLKAVPATQRNAVADVIAKMPVETYADLNAAIRYLLSETVRGNVHPEIMQLAIRVMEFSAVTVAARNAIDGTASGGMGALVSALKEAKRDLPKLEAKFSSDHPVSGVIDVLPARRAQ